ncbi:MAG: M20/M25/M40 family metallo-hydrolase [Anaerolineae bacterium]|nr:M20/M25/M40 family metallo-hydrolase [Anaerolineae bacterium]
MDRAIAELRALLDELVPAPGLSGHEAAGIAGRMAGALRPGAGRVWADPLGNVIARFGREDAPRRTAVLAHMDTVGFLVKTAEEGGILRAVPVGGVNVLALPGAAVRVFAGQDAIPGVIGVRSQHLAAPGDAAASPDDLYVHVDPADAPRIEITAPVLYAPKIVSLGERRVAAPYLDNRAGCAVLAALARTLAGLPDDRAVYLIATVQEETTCLGALGALQQVAPERALFIDGTLAYDTPETRARGAVRLGGGPVLTAFLYTSGLNGWHADPGWRAHLKQQAAAHGIACQQDAVRGLMSDARAAAQLGIPSVIVGLPMRSKHAPLEMVDLADLAGALRLIATELSDPYTPS